MKKLSWIFLFMTAITMSLVGCSDDPAPTPDPNPVTGLTFEVEIEEVTKARMFFDVTPSDSEAEYMCLVYDAEFVDGYANDDYLFGEICTDLTEYANTIGLTLEEYLAANADKGTVTDGTVSGLATSTDYYLLVFGFEKNDDENAEEEFVLTSSIVREPFTTQPAPQLDVTFDVTATVDMNTVEFAVVPSDKTIKWHLITLPQADIDYYLGDEGGMTLQSFYMKYTQQEIDTLIQRGYSETEVINSLFFNDDQKLTAKGLDAYTEYGYLIAGFVFDEDGTYLATDISEGGYQTYEPRYTGMTFEVTVSDIETTRAAITIVPSSLTDTYFSLISVYDGVSTADELMEMNLQQWGDWMFAMAKYTGGANYTGNKKFRLDSDDTEYYILNFGYAGGVTSEPNLVTFRTKKGLEADEAEFSVSVSNITSFGADINVTVNDDSVQYIFGVMKPSEFDADTIVKDYNAGFEEMYAEAKAFDPATTYASIFSQYYWRDTRSLSISGLVANTEYMGFVLALDDKTGKVAKVHTFDSLFSTIGEGNINPTLENLGVWSGDDENGTIFGDAALTKGKAIGALKINDFEGASRLMWTSVEGDYSYEAAYSDGYMYASFNWAEMDMESPYIFTLISWAKDYTFAAYAVDENGGSGKIGRMLVNATANDKRPIEELRDLYDLAEGRSEAYVPGSVVINKDVTPTNAIITAKEIATIEKQTIEASEPVVKPVLMQFDYIGRHTFRD